MTTCQTVLASMVDSSYATLEGSSRQKKQPLFEMELASLKREETAKKGKNLGEDERAETINHLLKKQSRPRARRMPTTDSPFPGSSTPTGFVYRFARPGGDHNAKTDANASDNAKVDLDENAMDVEHKSAPGKVERKIVMSFSVPASALPGWEAPEEYPSPEAFEREQDPNLSMQMGPGWCAIDGCGAKRKYWCVKDWTVGACGMAHSKVLEARWVGS
ncbi:hypothetical protein FA15DRAFT_599045 [Coprinopsis marcescibilis]|uniref:INO80 complex subunit B-like conserved region domain-containing protein n=1 Tax=Coprinopsis marcescibilis TaxID=230819 RepID=A0A5C3KLE7_COPMA|nr:hypothetical protein FA15DRAFT_599045 [Coprinopsis marcescibilis]